MSKGKQRAFSNVSSDNYSSLDSAHLKEELNHIYQSFERNNKLNQIIDYCQSILELKKEYAKAEFDNYKIECLKINIPSDIILKIEEHKNNLLKIRSFENLQEESKLRMGEYNKLKKENKIIEKLVFNKAEKVKKEMEKEFEDYEIQKEALLGKPTKENLFNFNMKLIFQHANELSDENRGVFLLNLFKQMKEIVKYLDYYIDEIISLEKFRSLNPDIIDNFFEIHEKYQNAYKIKRGIDNKRYEYIQKQFLKEHPESKNLEYDKFQEQKRLWKKKLGEKYNELYYCYDKIHSSEKLYRDACFVEDIVEGVYWQRLYDLHELLKMELTDEIKLINKKSKYNRTQSKLTWAGSKNDFVKLMERLIVKNWLLLPNNKYQIICKHFEWDDGEMTPNQLKQINNNLSRKEGTYHMTRIMEQFLNELDEQ